MLGKIKDVSLIASAYFMVSCVKKAMYKPNHIKYIIKSEMRAFIFYTIFLALLFSSFSMYRRVLLHDYGNKSIEYGYAIIEALILAKVIMIGRAMKIGERYARKPLIVPVVYKTIIFCLLMFVIHICGYMVIAFLSGENTIQVVNHLTESKINETIAQSMVMIFVFIFFFSFQEIGRVLGAGSLYKLFFKSRES